MKLIHIDILINMDKSQQQTVQKAKQILEANNKLLLDLVSSSKKKDEVDKLYELNKIQQSKDKRSNQGQYTNLDFWRV